MSYNVANVHDLTAPQGAPGSGAPFSDPAGTNAFEPHPWGGVPGIFKALTVQAGLDYDVSLSTRNAATLRGHYLNSTRAIPRFRTDFPTRSTTRRKVLAP
jgi:hypothetical protein